MTADGGVIFHYSWHFYVQPDNDRTSFSTGGSIAGSAESARFLPEIERESAITFYGRLMF
jgi:hypothetical protein